MTENQLNALLLLFYHKDNCGGINLDMVTDIVKSVFLFLCVAAHECKPEIYSLMDRNRYYHCVPSCF